MTKLFLIISLPLFSLMSCSDIKIEDNSSNEMIFNNDSCKFKLSFELGVDTTKFTDQEIIDGTDTIRYKHFYKKYVYAILDKISGDTLYKGLVTKDNLKSKVSIDEYNHGILGDAFNFNFLRNSTVTHCRLCYPDSDACRTFKIIFFIDNVLIEEIL